MADAEDKALKDRIKERLARIESSPERTYKRITGGTYGFLDIIRRILKYFFTWGLVALLLLGFAVGETQAGAIAGKGLTAAWDVIWHPENFVKPGGALSFDEEQVEEEKFGLTITKFRADGFFELG